MNIFDIGIILLFLMAFIVGFYHGFVREGISLIGIIVIFLISFFTKGYIGNFLCTNLPFFNFFGPLKGLTTLNIIIYQTIAFILIFTILLTVYIIIVKLSKIAEKVVDFTIILWLPSKLLGALLCIIEVFLFLYIILLLLSVPLSTNKYFHESTAVNIILYKTPILGKTKIAKSVKEVSQFAIDIKDEKLDKEEANKKILVVLLDNNIVDIDTVNKLNDQKKLKIKGLKKY